MSIFRQSRSACPICGAKHSACAPVGHSSDSPITVVQMPARDAVRTHDEALAEVQQTHPNAVSTKTYPHTSTAARNAALASGQSRQRRRG